MSTRTSSVSRSLQVGLSVVLTTLAFFAPGCRTTDAVSCGDEEFCPADSVCTPSQDPPVCVPARGCGNGVLDEADGEECDDGNIVDDDGCNSTCKSDETCGNRFVDSHLKKNPEECDDGRATRNCNADCTLSECGDGKVNKAAGEVCDDGGTEPGDGCDAACQSEECGNGVLEEAFGEECDDGNDDNDDGCSANCKLESCGNGKRDPGEQCDDGNDDNEDSCVIVGKDECFTAYCGDGFVWSKNGGKEECDDGGQSAICNSNCTRSRCGDGIVNAQAGEACDTKGQTAACNANCTIAVCGDGVVNAALGEECDDGGESATCNANCTWGSCGDGVLNRTASEVCDDGGETTTCDSDCSPALCGDGTRNRRRGEVCDGGGETASCDVDCTDVRCGDGTRNQTAGEECDTGGESVGCNADCTFATCGDTKVNEARGEQCDTGGDSDTCNADCTQAACGDGKLNAAFVVDLMESSATLTGKQCDPNTGTTGNRKRARQDSATCNVDCSAPRCGDGHVNAAAGEECDPDYQESGSPPNTEDCDRDCTRPACGDGLVNEEFPIRLMHRDGFFPREQCDPGTGITSDDQRAERDTDGCDHDCSTVRCGDAYINTTAGEECEHEYRTGGTPDWTSECYADCRIPRCGDGIVYRYVRNGSTVNEACDPGTGTTSDRGRAAADHRDCDSNCTEARCGDGDLNRERGETCDDGNNTAGDGCDASCQVE